MDNMIGEIDRRFSNKNFNIMQGVQALNPSSTTFLREETVLLLGNAYDSNIEDLKHELHQTRRVLERKNKEMESTYHSDGVCSIYGPIPGCFL
jgi:hypothetical protein